jgi:hypothetical protein
MGFEETTEIESPELRRGVGTELSNLSTILFESESM